MTSYLGNLDVGGRQETEQMRCLSPDEHSAFRIPHSLCPRMRLFIHLAQAASGDMRIDFRRRQ